MIFLLSSRKLVQARRGNHNFIRIVGEVAGDGGMTVSYVRDSPAAHRAALQANAWTMTHMSEPVDERGLCFRNAYAGSFWRIEQVAARWNWPVAAATFDPQTVPEDQARAFFRRWQQRLYRAPLATGVSRDGFIYVPLQGRLLERRSFQTHAPIEMIRQTLTHDSRPVRATLHPRETYTDAELAALDRIAREVPRFTVDRMPMAEALRTCDFLVTENSSAAFHGMFFGKPAVLFAGIDFHHPMASVGPLDVASAFAAARADAGDYARYLYWFWGTALNMGRADRHDRIRERLNNLAWPVGS